MATAEVQVTTVEQHFVSRIGVARLAAAIGVGSALIFLLCWLGTFISFSSPTHAYISLFTLADPQSAQGLAEGTIFSLLFGFVSGGIIAFCYNMFARLDRH